MRRPERLRGCGTTRLDAATHVVGPTMPSRGSPAAFCNAYTACSVASSNSAVGVPSQ